MTNRNPDIIKKLENLIAEGKLSEALDYLETLPQQEREHWEVQNLIGIISSYCGEYAEAVSFFRSALKQNPDSADIYYNLADAYFAQCEYRRAELMLNFCEYNTDDTALLDAVAQLRAEISSVRAEHPESSCENSVLMIPYYFPPLSGSGVFRSVKFVKYLPACGWQPTVISTDMPPVGWKYSDDSMVKEIPDNINVIRIPDYLSSGRELSIPYEKLNTLINFLGNILRHDKNALTIFTSLLEKEENLRRLITFPCPCLCWAFDVISYIEENMNIRDYKVIYTTSGPASSHLIGFYLKEKYGIPWVADYRDDWSKNPYASHDTSDPMVELLDLLENILLQKADCNIYAEEDLPQEYIRDFHLPQHKVACITNGYDEDDFSGLSPSREKTEKFTILHNGILYSSNRNIGSILIAIRQLSDEHKIDENRICLRLVGDGNVALNSKLAEHFNLEHILVHTGYVSHKESLQANLDSNILLLIIGDEDKFKHVYCGKVFEYLRSKRKILALAPENGAIDKLLSATKQGIALRSTQISEIKAVILEEYEAWLSGSGHREVYSPLIRQRERKYLTLKLADIFDQLSH